MRGISATVRESERILDEGDRGVRGARMGEKVFLKCVFI